VCARLAISRSLNLDLAVRAFGTSPNITVGATPCSLLGAPQRRI
jgi:hypothetical protein